MKIARYIGDLLYDYECVVIPGLGGFLTNDKPASIQSNTHHFHPPYKQVMFNAYLKTNDGLLIKYIARKEKISYKEAKAQVDEFVYLCNNALKSGEKVNFYKVGSLYLNNNGKIIFEQDNTINYNADAFGLTGFVSPAVRRASAEEKLRKAVVANRTTETTAVKEIKKQNRKVVPASEAANKKHSKLIASHIKSPYKTQLVFLVALVLAMMVGWGFMNKDTVNGYFNNYSSVIPLFYSQPNAYVISNIDKVPITKVTDSKFGSWWINLFEESTVNTTSEKETKHPASVASHSEKIIPVKVNAKKENGAREEVIARPLAKKEASNATIPVKRMQNPHRYFVIAGAFQNTYNVRMLMRSLKNKGYNPFLAGESSSGLHRVAFGVFDSFSQADKQLQIIRKKENPAAWILIK